MKPDGLYRQGRIAVHGQTRAITALAYRTGVQGCLMVYNNNLPESGSGRKCNMQRSGEEGEIRVDASQASSYHQSDTGVVDTNNVGRCSTRPLVNADNANRAIWPPNESDLRGKIIHDSVCPAHIKMNCGG